MQIANPIYDVVFRYLMQDNKVAKLILSALTGEDIVKLEFKSTERSLKYDGLPTVLRMDFAALIKTADGEHKHVLIELQKAKYYLEVMRFRRYLGEQYADMENKIEHVKEKTGKVRIEGRRLLPIFILGEKITSQPIPVLRVGRKYVDVATNEEHDFKHEFIEALTHDGIFVQIPHLKGRRRTDLEQLLHVFDQSNVGHTQKFFLEINDADYPDKYRSVIRRLKQAIAEKEVVDQMKTEDELIDVFRHTEREMERAEKLAKEEKQRADEEKQRAEAEKHRADEEKQRADAEKQRADAEKHRAEAQKHRADEEKQRAEAEKQRADDALKALKKAAEKLRQVGVAPGEIARLLDKTEAEIAVLLNED